MMLASATSLSSRVITDDSHSTCQPGLLHQSSNGHNQDEKESFQKVSCNSSELCEDVLPHEDATNGAYNDIVDDFGVKTKMPSSTEYCDSTGEMHLANSGVLTAAGADGGVTDSGGKVGSVAYSATELVDHLGKLDCNGHAVQSDDQLWQENNCSVISHRSDICIDHDDHQDGERVSSIEQTDSDDQTLSRVDQTDHLEDRNGHTVCHVDQTDHIGQLDGLTHCCVDQTGHLDDHISQTSHHVNQADHLVDHDSQTLSRVDQTDRLEDQNGHTVCHVDQTDHIDRDGQTHCYVDQTGHLDDHISQTSHHVDQANHLEDRNGHTVCHVDQTDHIDHDGQTHCCVDQTDHLDDHISQTFHHVDQSNHDGPTLCHVDQVVMLTRLPASQVIKVNHCTVDQIDHPDDHSQQT